MLTHQTSLGPRELCDRRGGRGQAQAHPGASPDTFARDCLLMFYTREPVPRRPSANDQLASRRAQDIEKPSPRHRETYLPWKRPRRARGNTLYGRIELYVDVRIDQPSLFVRRSPTSWPYLPPGSSVGHCPSSRTRKRKATLAPSMQRVTAPHT